MDEKLRILLCEDDENLGMLLREYLQAKGYSAELYPDGEAGYKAFLKNKYDLCVFDVMMPKKDGFTLAQDVRAANAEIPIIFLTAKTLKEDILEGFKIGADDYITKPFSLREVSARVRALLRRTYGEILQPEQVLRYGALELDVTQHVLRCDGRVVELTPIEFGLLEVFMRAPQRVFNRLQLMENTHGFAFDGYERTMDAHIRNLRKKIEKDSRRPEYILTVYGIGYKFGGDSNA